MPTVASLVAEVKIQGADTAKQQLSGVGQAAKETQSGFGGMLKNALGMAAGFAIFNVGAKAVSFLKDQVASTVQVTLQHQQVAAQTAQAIKSTGDASGMTAQAISNLATSLSKVTTFSQDTVQSGENILLTFTGIGKDVFPQTTKTMLDMAQAMGMDTKSAAMQLGKALNDPAQGLSALSREGVTFSDKQKEMIKQMVAAGNTAGAQKIMLQELQKEFGGSAEAAGKTFGGQLQILQNNLDNVKISIGTALLPILGQMTGSISSMVLPAVSNFASYLSSPAFQNFATGVGQKLTTTFQSIGTFIKNNVVPAVNDFVGVIKSPQFADFVGKMETLGTTLLNTVSPAFGSTKPQVDSLFNFIKTTAVPALSDLVGGLTNTVKWLKDHGNAVQFAATLITALYVPALIKSGVEAVAAGVKTAASYTANIIKVGVEGFQAAGKVLAFVVNIISSGVEAVIAGTKIAVSFVANIIKSGVEAAIAGAKIVANFIGSMITTGTEAVVNGAKVVGSFIASMITAGAQAIVSGAQIVASFVAGLITAGAEAIVSAGIFLSTLVPSLLAVAAATIAATWPYLAIGAVVAAVVAGIVLAIQHWADISKWFQGVWTVTWNAVSTFFTNVWNGVISFLKAAWDIIVNIAKTAVQVLLDVIMGPIGLLAIYIIQHWADIQRFLYNAWDNIKNDASNAWNWIYNNIIGKAGDIFNGIMKPFNQARDSIGGVVKAFINNCIGMLNNGITGVESFVNFFGNAIDFVAGKLGAGSPIPHFGLGRIPQYASGTDSHPGGPAIVGEKGRELVMLPRGASVLPNDKTEALLGMLRGKIPGYADGIGQAAADFFSWVAGGAKSLLDNALKAFNVKAPNIPGMNNLASSMLAKIEDFALSWINKILPNFSSGPGGTPVNIPGNLQSWIAQAIAATGAPASWAADLGVIAMHESGGNPNAVNNWDSNAMAGDPSRGLFQTIGATFRAYALPGHGNILNPVDNAIAAIRYIMSRYGDVFHVPGIVSMAQGGGYIGYSQGGLLDETVSGIGLSTGKKYLFAENGPETVVPGAYLPRGVNLASQSMPPINITINVQPNDFNVDGQRLSGTLMPHIVTHIRNSVGAKI